MRLRWSIAILTLSLLVQGCVKKPIPQPPLPPIPTTSPAPPDGTGTITIIDDKQRDLTLFRPDIDFSAGLSQSVGAASGSGGLRLEGIVIRGIAPTGPRTKLRVPVTESDAAALAELGTAGYALDMPSQLTPGRPAPVDLYLDPAPAFAATQLELESWRAKGYRPGVATRVSEFMRAGLQGSDNVRISSLDEEIQDLGGGSLAHWAWNVRIVGDGISALLRLSLEARVTVRGRTKFLRVPGFPVAREIPFTVAVLPPVTATHKEAHETSRPAAEKRGPPAARWQWLWLAAGTLGLILVAGAIWLLRHRRKTDSTHASQPPLVIDDGEGLVVTLRVLVIHHRDDRAAAESVSGPAASPRIQYLWTELGFAQGSATWKSNFEQRLESADAILAILTQQATPDPWLNWQLERARKLHERKGIPIYAAAKPNILEIRRTFELLEGVEFFDAATPDQTGLQLALRRATPQALRQLRCFISYSHAHPKLPARICAGLQHAGIHAWMDVDGIPGGVEWKVAIASAIERSTHLILFLTPQSAKSDQVQEEILWAEKHKKTIVPILEFEMELPFGLLSTQYIAFNEGYENGFRKLLASLAAASTPERASSRKAGAA